MRGSGAWPKARGFLMKTSGRCCGKRRPIDVAYILDNVLYALHAIDGRHHALLPLLMLALWWMAKTPTTKCRLDLGPIEYHDQFAFPKYIPKKLWSPLRIEGGQRYQLQLLDAVAARIPSGFSHGEGVSGNIGTGISSHPIILNKKLVTSIWQVALADIAVKYHLVNSEDPMSFEAQAHSS